jgi:MFS family permease
MSIVNGKSNRSNYRWYILVLATLTNALPIAFQAQCMPVLFKEISEDMGLSLVQIGTVWGMVAFGGIFTSMIGGVLGDRFGVKRTLAIACLVAGLSGALRGVSANFITLAATMFLVGLLTSSIAPGIHKAASIWFPGRQLGLANGVIMVGAGVGGTVTAMISATIMSPLLGGWRNVMFLYGALPVILSILWLTSRGESGQVDSSDNSASTVPFRQALSRVARMRGVWLLGVSVALYAGCYQGMIAYLPMYLENIGWTTASASGVVAASSAASMIAAIPIALLSDKLGSRKAILLAGALICAIGVGLLPVLDGPWVWVAMIISGIPLTGYLGVLMTMTTETAGALYAGTAMGLVLTVFRVGGVASPPLGNSFAAINPSLPFVFWAAMAGVSLVTLYFVKDTGQRQE